MRIRSFQAWRPSAEAAPKMASLPYDVVSREEAHAMAQENPLSFMKVIRPESNFSLFADAQDSAIYKEALRVFTQWKNDGHVIQDEDPCLYLYEISMGEHSQIGVACLCNVDDLEKKLIKTHEQTREEKVKDRIELADTLNAHAEPVFLVYRDQPEVDTLFHKVTQTRSLYNFTTERSIRHRIWKIDPVNSLKWINAFKHVDHVYVADGHHRCACAQKLAHQLRDKTESKNPNDPFNWFLSVIFPASQVQIFPYNRVIKDLNGMEPEAFLTKLRKHVPYGESDLREPQNPHMVNMYLGSKWYTLDLSGKTGGQGAAGKLDVSLLQQYVLEPLLGIEDERTSERIAFIGGPDAALKVEESVDRREAEIGFSMYPMRVEELLTVADLAENLPPKSTWFAPKLLSGLLVHEF